MGGAWFVWLILFPLTALVVVRMVAPFGRESTITSVACLGGAIVGGGSIFFGVHIICGYLLCNLFYFINSRSLS